MVLRPLLGACRTSAPWATAASWKASTAARPAAANANVEITDTLNDLQKVIDLADFNDEEKLGKGKEMQDRLTKLVAIFNDLDFRRSRAEGDDLLGDAYEYLMRHFATESGKSKGQFYTGRGLAGTGQGLWHRPAYPPGPDRLRPDLRLWLPAAEGGR